MISWLTLRGMRADVPAWLGMDLTHRRARRRRWRPLHTGAVAFVVAAIAALGIAVLTGAGTPARSARGTGPRCYTQVFLGPAAECMRYRAGVLPDVALASHDLPALTFACTTGIA